jgi:hypothetical protein
MKRPVLLLVAALLGVSACGTRYIGNTRIEDTDENRAILRVVEQYRRAVEDRDVERVLSLTSDRYFEDPGTPHNPADDYDKAGLRERLVSSFAKVQEQRLTIDARRVELNEDENEATVDYRFDFRYRLDLPQAGGQWREQNDLNRLEVRLEGEDWKIVSGL